MPGGRERKVVTVLFADLAGFTSRAETMDPEDVADYLGRYHAHLKGELERRGGTVEKFIGDAVMAVFGAPVAHEDDAERAVRAALAIRDWAGEEGIELRVGVNTGEALVVLDAQPGEGQAMAAGDVVNTAARLQAAAPPGGVLVGERTFRATEKAIEFEPAPPVEAKGKAEPVAVWRAVEARSRVGVERVHGATLVGRSREVELLVAALERSRRDRSPELVTVVGVPGIGKSRLVVELYRRIEQEEELTSWRYGRCLPYGDGVTFWALGEIVKAQAGIREDDDEAEIERKLGRAADDPWVAGHLRPLVGLSAGMDGGGGRDEAFAAWRRFFEELADRRPLVLVFEDLHWADEHLLDFVDHLVDWVGGVPLLVLCTARPELFSRRPGWGGGKPNAHTISLSPLSDDETALLVSALLERSVLPAETQAELLARAGGNPLYAEEYTRVLRERGRLDELPATVQGLIAARLDLLEPAEKSLVQDAAVVGRTFWLGALAGLTGDQPRVLDAKLHALERKEFVRRERASSFTDDTEYSFRHLLVRDVAYATIPRADRAAKHRAAAEWLERAGRPDDHAEMLAFHYLQAVELAAAAGLEAAELVEPARSALAVAGDRAYGLGAYETAARYYGAALELLPGDDARRAGLLLSLGMTKWQLGQSSLEDIEEARDLFVEAGNDEEAGLAEVRLAEQLWLQGDRAAAFGHLEGARAFLDPLPASFAKAHMVSTTARLRMLGAEDEEAIRLGREAVKMAEQLGFDAIRAAALNNVGTARGNLGDDGGLDDLAEAVRVAAAASAPFELCRARGNLAAHTWMRGDLERALGLWLQARADAERFGQLAMRRWMDGVTIDKHWALGDWETALAKAESFIADVEAGSPHYLATQAYMNRGLVRLATGDREGALADANEAVTLGRRAADPQNLLPALARAAFVLCELGDREGAAMLASEFLDAPDVASEGYAAVAAIELAWALVALGRADELVRTFEGLRFPWAQAAVAYARGDPVTAADVCARMGAVSYEAYARLEAARVLQSEGLQADRELHRALAFFRSVGATSYVRRGEALLAASA
ncbi:MAG TPA: adenylate/guanylate cyclase domain-containing protein [Gaiellaceae bacterium]|nr:adenylate/guanylate cyclase domain-containing protein [Gaiellaceae bacterium]